MSGFDTLPYCARQRSELARRGLTQSCRWRVLRLQQRIALHTDSRRACRTQQSVFGWDEHVADPAHGADRLGVGRIGLDLATQSGMRRSMARSNASASRCAVTSNSQSRINGRLGFSARIFNRSNSLAVSRSSLPSAGSIGRRRSRSSTGFRARRNPSRNRNGRFMANSPNRLERTS
jgi:hypothetical protein